MWRLFGLFLFVNAAARADEGVYTPKLGYNFRHARWSDGSLPIFKRAKPYRSSSGRPLYYYERSLREVLQETEKDHGEIVVDCTLFVQIASAILAGALSEPRFFLDYEGGHFMGTLSRERKQSFFYVSPFDSRAQKALQKLPLLNKGQWVLAIGDHKYLGLSPSGLVVASAGAWIQKMRAGLHFEIHDGDLPRLAEELPPARRCEAILLIENAQHEARQLEWHGLLEHWELRPR